ncbi:hypothetical protein DLAC_10299 [Tieghemostelium lacteum]|uniref:Uncharacterized protein n=1 Tax=Tieghemostelium lacteum TaxID=361077 RepID=A0A151Z552_TIELA|nr:hypothetical protein DLAC_10299 [Tieghemostelium lacteum]|eukprot:KYQ89071.1 hypothetical protein DLAC_10299 [Tieghemostelium lacteum]
MVKLHSIEIIAFLVILYISTVQCQPKFINIFGASCKLDLCEVQSYNIEVHNQSKIEPLHEFSVGKDYSLFGYYTKDRILYLQRWSEGQYQYHFADFTNDDFNDGGILNGDHKLAYGLKMVNPFAKLWMVNEKFRFVFMGLAVGENSHLVVKLFEHYYSPILNFNTTVQVNEKELGSFLTSSDMKSKIYYAYFKDIKNQYYVSLFNYTEICPDENCGNPEQDPCHDGKCEKAKTIHPFSMNLTNLHINGHKNLVYFSGNDPVTQRLAVYSFNMTSKKLEFLFSKNYNLSHTIDQSSNHGQNDSRYCLFYSHDAHWATIFYFESGKYIDYQLNIPSALLKPYSSVYYFVSDLNAGDQVPLTVKDDEFQENLEHNSTAAAINYYNRYVLLSIALLVLVLPIT